MTELVMCSSLVSLSPKGICYVLAVHQIGCQPFVSFCVPCR